MFVAAPHAGTTFADTVELYMYWLPFLRRGRAVEVAMVGVCTCGVMDVGGVIRWQGVPAAALHRTEGLQWSSAALLFVADGMVHAAAQRPRSPPSRLRLHLQVFQRPRGLFFFRALLFGGAPS